MPHSLPYLNRKALSPGWRFALGGTCAWLMLLGALIALALRAPGPIKDATGSEFVRALAIPGGWLGLMVAMLARLAFNLFTPQRRKAYAFESIFLLVALAAQLFMAIGIITHRWEG